MNDVHTKRTLSQTAAIQIYCNGEDVGQCPVVVGPPASDDRGIPLFADVNYGLFDLMLRELGNQERAVTTVFEIEGYILRALETADSGAFEYQTEYDGLESLRSYSLRWELIS